MRFIDENFRIIKYKHNKRHFDEVWVFQAHHGRRQGKFQKYGGKRHVPPLKVKMMD